MKRLDFINNLLFSFTYWVRFSILDHFNNLFFRCVEVEVAGQLSRGHVLLGDQDRHPLLQVREREHSGQV